MICLRPSMPQDADRAVDIWRRAVAATHDFLKPDDRDAIEMMVRAFLPTAPLWLAVDGQDRAIGFLLLTGEQGGLGHMDALFIDPLHRGTGVGRALVNHGLSKHPVLTVDVNEQNEQAVGFYAAMGFMRTGRSDRDAQGRPYPLIHMRRDGGGAA